MRQGRTSIVALIIVSLIATAFARHLAHSRRFHAIYSEAGRAPMTSQSSLSSMNSFALALLLGGLRGPLVMFLWPSTETQRVNRDLEDIDTKIEWIRLLQSEFDSVHLFQIWNKAYNISVQMASLHNKYTAVLDALEYGARVDRERPHNLNIMTALADIYANKFGGSAEKEYYRERVQQESLPHADQQKRRDDPAWRRMQLDPMLDEQGKILPKYLEVRRPRPADLAADNDWNTGGELQYLPQFEPYPYGLSPFALAYNYYKRAEVLQTVHHQQPEQLSQLVVSSRPGITLMQWMELEIEFARKAEISALGLPQNSDQELGSAGIPLSTAVADPEGYDRATYSYQQAIRLSVATREEFRRHILRFTQSLRDYTTKTQEVEAVANMIQGDLETLQGMRATGSERTRLLASAATHYRDSIIQNQRIVLSYNVQDEVAAAVYPKGYTKLNVGELPPEQYPRLLQATQRYMIDQKHYDVHHEDRAEYEKHIERATRRLQQLQTVVPAGSTNPK
jgi:hypothetical protein